MLRYEKDLKLLLPHFFISIFRERLFQKKIIEFSPLTYHKNGFFIEYLLDKGKIRIYDNEKDKWHSSKGYG
jgi:hypothetical protein